MTEFKDFNDFMKTYNTRGDKTKVITHTRIGDKDLNIFAGAYSIPEDKLPEFYRLYKENYKKGNKEYLTEKQLTENRQMVVDLDFRYNYDIDTRQHTEEHLDSLINAYLEEFKNYFVFDKQTNILVYVMEKPNVNRLEDKSLTKDGIHFVFGLSVPYDIQLQIRQVMIEKGNELLTDLPLTNSMDSVFDKGLSAGTCNWMLFGSQKPSNQAYQVIKTYEVGYDESDGEFMMNPIKFDFDRDFEKLSAQYKAPKYEINSNYIKIQKNTFKPISSSPKSVTEINNLEQNGNKYVDLLLKIGNKGHKRADWVSICGWCHSNSTKNVFINFVSSDWKDDAIKMWDSMKQMNIPIYWLETFAKRINLSVYKEWIDKWNIYYIDADDIDDSFKVAKTISNTLKSTLILCNEKWFMLTDKQLWKQQKEPSFYIINELRKYIDESNKKIVFKISQSDGEVKDKLVEKSKLYLKSYKTISSSGYLNVLTKFLRTPLADNTFEMKLDNNFGKLAFQNGIMDLETKEFRIGIQADDFITNTIPYDYKPACNIKKEYVKEKLLEILNNNKEHLEYFLSLIGFSFIGSPHLEKSLYFCVDKTDKSAGDNGKTFFFDILSALLPNYVYKTNKSFLEEKNSKVHKQLVNMKGKRLVWLDEFNENKTNPELMKVIGEGSEIENEILFGTAEIINIMFKLWTLTNHIPNIEAKETAVYNRYKQISYGSHFDRTGKRIKSNPDKLEFIADTTLGDKIKTEYYNEVFELIIDYANEYYKSKKLPSIPLQFQNDTKETQMKNDTFGSWFSDNCTINEDERVALKALVNSSGLNEKQVKEGMIRLGFKYDKDLRKLGKDESGNAYKGGFIGCKINPEEVEE